MVVLFGLGEGGGELMAGDQLKCDRNITRIQLILLPQNILRQSFSEVK